MKFLRRLHYSEVYMVTPEDVPLNPLKHYELQIPDQRYDDLYETLPIPSTLLDRWLGMDLEALFFERDLDRPEEKYILTQMRSKEAEERE